MKTLPNRFIGLVNGDFMASVFTGHSFPEK